MGRSENSEDYDFQQNRPGGRLMALSSPAFQTEGDDKALTEPQRTESYTIGFRLTTE